MAGMNFPLGREIQMLNMNTDEVFNTIIDKLEGWTRAAVAHLPNLALAILCVAVTIFVAKLINRYSKKYMVKWGTNTTIAGFLGRIFFVIILALGIMLALSILDLSRTVASMLAGVGIIGLALGFAFQDTAANFISGIFITFQHPFRVGDVISTADGQQGKVIDISLRITKIKTWDGPIAHIPNRMLFEDHFINYTENGIRRVRVACGISYGDDLEKVERVVMEAVENLPSRIKDEEITFHWKEFGDSSINFTVNIWMAYSREELKYIGVKNEAIKAIKKAFDENDIMIPFPIRTLDFGIKGGEKLGEVITETGLVDGRSKENKRSGDNGEN